MLYMGRGGQMIYMTTDKDEVCRMFEGTYPSWSPRSRCPMQSDNNIPCTYKFTKSNYIGACLHTHHDTKPSNVI